jgi:hypothetical protein
VRTAAEAPTAVHRGVACAQLEFLKSNIDGLSKVVAGKQDNLEAVVNVLQRKVAAATA